MAVMRRRTCSASLAPAFGASHSALGFAQRLNRRLAAREALVEIRGELARQHVLDGPQASR